MTLKDIVEIIISFVTGAGFSAVITFNVTKKSRKNTVTQKGNTAGGDIVGGNKN